MGAPQCPGFTEERVYESAVDLACEIRALGSDDLTHFSEVGVRLLRGEHVMYSYLGPAMVMKAGRGYTVAVEEHPITTVSESAKRLGTQPQRLHTKFWETTKGPFKRQPEYLSARVLGAPNLELRLEPAPIYQRRLEQERMDDEIARDILDN